MNYRQRLQNVIPGGAHTYSKGSDQFPSNAPQILSKGKGAYVFEPSGKKYLDYGMGLRSVTLGYAEKSINKAVMRGVSSGNNLTLPTHVELNAAELMTNQISSFEMVKFAKNGSTAVTAAVKLARAFTGRQVIAICEDHPFFSYDDWFISSTNMSRGVSEPSKAQFHKFKYNNAESLRNIFSMYPEQVAAIILEPCTYNCPHDKTDCPCLKGEFSSDRNFLNEVRDIADEFGAVFILDEMITGFRWSQQGAQSLFGVTPDLSTFGKAMANGYSVACVGGRREIMDLGGITNLGNERVFLMSSTHGAEMSGLEAFVETQNQYTKKDVVSHIWEYGRKFVQNFNELSNSFGLEDSLFMRGFDCSPILETKDHSGINSLALKTLFNQELLKSGVLMPWVSFSVAHGDRELELTLNASERAMSIYSKALKGTIQDFLIGDIQKPVFRQFN